MSAALEPGMWVECVDALGHEPPGTPTPLRVGAVYQVVALVRDWSGDGLTLREIETPEGATGFAVFMFKPIDSRTTELFRSLLQPSPELVNEGVLEEVV